MGPVATCSAGAARFCSRTALALGLAAAVAATGARAAPAGAATAPSGWKTMTTFSRPWVPGAGERLTGARGREALARTAAVGPRTAVGRGAYLDAISPLSTAAGPKVVTSWAGLDSAANARVVGNGAVVPPDPQVTVGPSDVIEMVNEVAQVSTRAGQALATFDLRQLFGLPPGYDFSDPRILYDPSSQRWFASGVGVDFTTPASEVVLAVSSGPDPTGTWSSFVNNPTAGALYDQPKMGLTDDTVVIAFNDFDASGGFAGGEIDVLDKAAVTSGTGTGPIPTTVHGPDPNLFGVVPAERVPGTTSYAVFDAADPAEPHTAALSAAVLAISGDPAQAPATVSEALAAVAPTSLPPDAAQAGTATLVQTNDDRFLSAVWDNGSIWVAGDDGCSPAGSPQVMSCARVLELTPGPAGVALGADFDASSGPGTSLYFPALAVDGAGNVALVASTSSPSSYPGVVVLGPLSATGPGGSTLLAAGGGAYCPVTTNRPGCETDSTGGVRWGDYSGAASDPSSPGDLWVAGEVAPAAGSPALWATAVGEVTLGASGAPAGTAGPGRVPGASLAVARQGGLNRDLTSVVTSVASFPVPGSARAVVLASDAGYPDALSGTPLAVARHGPLLLSPPGGLDPAVAQEIRRVAAPGATVYVLGGSSALSPTIDAAVNVLGYSVQRVAGPDRFATAVAVAVALGSPSAVLEATGTDFPDALAAGAAAAKAGAAVLLTDGSAQAAETAAYLRTHPGVHDAIGGPAAAADPGATPVVGSDRFATATMVATHFFAGPTIAGFASAVAFPDALSGGASIGLQGGPLLLVPAGGPLPASLVAYLAGTTSITSALVFGGTSAVGPDVVTELGAA